MAVVGTLAGLAVAVFSGLLTSLGALLDPTWLVSNPQLAVSLGWSIVKGGERLAPGLPWDKIVLVLLTLTIVLTLGKIYDKRRNQT